MTDEARDRRDVARDEHDPIHSVERRQYHSRQEKLVWLLFFVVAVSSAGTLYGVHSQTQALDARRAEHDALARQINDLQLRLHASTAQRLAEVRRGSRRNHQLLAANRETLEQLQRTQRMLVRGQIREARLNRFFCQTRTRAGLPGCQIP